MGGAGEMLVVCKCRAVAENSAAIGASSVNGELVELGKSDTMAFAIAQTYGLPEKPAR